MDDDAAMSAEERDATFQFLCGAEDAYERVLELIALGADLNAHTDAGESALAEAAVASGTERIVELLLEKGAKVNVADQHGHTPLILAAARGAVAKCQAMLRHGADPNLATDDGETALIKAVQGAGRTASCVQVVSLLLEAGADASIAVTSGPRADETALTLATALEREAPEAALAILALLRAPRARAIVPRGEAVRLAPKVLVHIKGSDGKVLCGQRAASTTWTLELGTCPDCIALVKK